MASKKYESIKDAAAVVTVVCAGFVCHVFSRLDQASSALKRIEPAAILLDVDFADETLGSVLLRLQSLSPALIICLSAYGSISRQVQAFELGADDYISKYLGPRFVAKKVRVLLRRSAHVYSGDITLTMAFNRGGIRGSFLYATVNIQGHTAEEGFKKTKNGAEKFILFPWFLHNYRCFH